MSKMLSYSIPDNGAPIQEGLFEDNIEVTVVKVEDVTPYLSAQGLNHMAFLRLYLIDKTRKNLVYERWTSRLKDQVQVEKVYRQYRPSGFCRPRYRVTQMIRDIIRYLLYGLMHLHRRGMCIGRDFAGANVVLVGDTPKFFDIGVLPATEELKANDYKNLCRLIKRDILAVAGERCPEDMLHFLELLARPRREETLIEHHCALWDESQHLHFFQRFEDEGKLIDDAIIAHIFYKLDTTGEFDDWQSQVLNRRASIVYEVYSKKTRLPAASGHFDFLRAYNCHAGDYSGRGVNYDRRMVEEAIIATFPRSLCLLMTELHKYKILPHFIRKREPAFE